MYIHVCTCIPICAKHDALMCYIQANNDHDTPSSGDVITEVRPTDHPRLAAPRGNALGQHLLQGWSSEFETTAEEEEPNLYDSDSVYTQHRSNDDYTPTPLGGVAISS